MSQAQSVGLRPGPGPGIVAVGETPALRHPESTCTTAGLMAQAIGQALRRVGIAPAQVDGLGVASFTLRPDRAIDLAWRLGLRLNWCMQDELGGASAIAG
jgi:3-oxoacyl-[acyl-carrier-protein] synthase III